MKDQPKPPSDLFINCFDEHCGSAEETCECGRHHYDTCNSYDHDWNTKLQQLELYRSQCPDQYIPHHCSIGRYEVDGRYYVMDCPCNAGYPYEQFIIQHAEKIAAYLNERAKKLREKAEKIEVKP